GRGLGMVEIAWGLNIAKSAVTKTVDRLEQRGLLDRDRDRDDRRTVYASLTSEGQKVFEAAQPSLVASVDQHFTRHPDPAHIRALHPLHAPVHAAVLADPRIGRGGTASAGHDDRRVADPRTRSAHLPGPDRQSRPPPPGRAHLR